MINMGGSLNRYHHHWQVQFTSVKAGAKMGNVPRVTLATINNNNHIQVEVVNACPWQAYLHYTTTLS